MRDILLFYCQHSLGIGHLTRSFALARALRERFRVVFLNGGRLPDGIAVPDGVECIDLPPLGMDDGHTVVSRDAAFDVQAAREQRKRLIGKAVASTKPAVLLVELFPFGRKKFANEILPMIRAVRACGVQPARHPGRCAARSATPRRSRALARGPLFRCGDRALGPGLRRAARQL
jgi:predicted glycosyltransferase